MTSTYWHLGEWWHIGISHFCIWGAAICMCWLILPSGMSHFRLFGAAICTCWLILPVFGQTSHIFSFSHSIFHFATPSCALYKQLQPFRYYLLQLLTWPLVSLRNEFSSDESFTVARFRRDLLYPDLRVAGRHPYPTDYQDNVWTHNIHAMVSKAHYIFLHVCTTVDTVALCCVLYVLYCTLLAGYGKKNRILNRHTVFVSILRVETHQEVHCICGMCLHRVVWSIHRDCISSFAFWFDPA